MRQASTILRIATPGQALIEITREVVDWVKAQDMTEGLLTLF